MNLEAVSHLDLYHSWRRWSRLILLSFFVTHLIRVTASLGYDCEMGLDQQHPSTSTCQPDLAIVTRLHIFDYVGYFFQLPNSSRPDDIPHVLCFLFIYITKVCFFKERTSEKGWSKNVPVEIGWICWAKKGPVFVNFWINPFSKYVL